MQNEKSSDIFSTRTLTISGMHCQSCVGRVETALLRIAGVAGATVDLSEQKANIRYNSAKVKIDDLKASVEAEGYHILDENMENSELNKECCSQSFNWISNPRSYLFGVIASFAIVGVYLGMNTLTADWYFAKIQFSEYRWWIITLAVGLGIQVTLFSGEIKYGRLRRSIRYCHDGLLLPLPCHCDTGTGRAFSISIGSSQLG
jgi:copper chaperone CopZ